MAQIAQFASLDSTQQLNQNVSHLLALQALNQSVGLIGRRVTASSGGQTISGHVTAVSLTNGAPRLTVTRDSDQAVFPNIAIGDLQAVLP